MVGGNVEMAEAYIGQGKILTTPLKMAQVASIIANGGRQVKPYILQKTVSPLGIVKMTEPSGSTVQVIDKSVADKVNKLMVEVVRNGT